MKQHPSICRLITGLLVITASIASRAGDVLSLDSCRALALANNKALHMSRLHAEAAHWQHKSVMTSYLPKISAIGTYQHTTREVSLLSKEQKQRLSGMGTTMAGAAAQGFQQGAASMQQQIAGLPESPQFQALMQDPQIQAIVQQSPTLQGLLNNPAVLQQLASTYMTQVGASLNTLLGSMAQMVDGVGQSIVDAFHTDTRNIAGAAVLLTQPIYMGGKIRAYDRITRLAEEAAAEQHSIEEQDLLVSVDEAYWRIVSLQAKKQLAQSFLETVQKLDADVQRIIGEGMATKADGLSVKVKVNEAEVAVIQVDNGLTLSRMALAQLCGLPLDADFEIADPLADDVALQSDPATDGWEARRPELRALDIAAQVSQQQVRVARSEFMPNVALTAGYLVTNPNLYDGFRRRFGGMWNIGVSVKVPILTWGDRVYKVRQAKAEAAIAADRLDEAREKISLQVSQCRQRVQEAHQRYAAAARSQSHADENLRIANLGMREGVIPVSDVLAAQTAWLSAHSTLVEASIDVRLAALHLQRATGTLAN